MGWLVVLVIAIIIGALIGYGNSGKEGAVQGAIAGGVGCGYILMQIFFWVIGIVIVIWIFKALFT